MLIIRALLHFSQDRTLFVLDMCFLLHVPHLIPLQEERNRVSISVVTAAITRIMKENRLRGQRNIRKLRKLV